jgi:LacI family repressor for deo operon, udp, cdd, tsx, nupC, and nupG
LKPPHRPTLSDVARLTSASTATASRALSNPDLVAADKREFVRSAAESCGYKINQLARSLRTQRSNTIPVVIPEINNQFYPEIITALEDTARNAGMSIILGLTYNRIDREDSYLELVNNQRADGLIVLDGGIDMLFKSGVRPRVPTVQVLERHSAAGLPVVRVDEHQVAGLAVRHLADLGHRRIAHIAGSSSSRVATERIAGFEMAMAAAGLSVDGNLILRGNYELDGGFAAMEQLLAYAEPPTAVLCANDSSTLGAVPACSVNGKSVPHYLSIVGIDDIAEAGLHRSPAHHHQAAASCDWRLCHESTAGFVAGQDES